MALDGSERKNLHAILHERARHRLVMSMTRRSLKPHSIQDLR